MRFFKKGGVGKPHTKARSPKEKHQNYTANLLNFRLFFEATAPNNGSVEL